LRGPLGASYSRPGILHAGYGLEANNVTDR
jgi:hypothetical protein